MRRLSRAAFGTFVLVSGTFAVWSCGGDQTGNDGGSDVSTSDNNVPDTSTKDTSTSDVTTDAADAGPRCTTTKPFGAMTLVSELGAADSGASGARLSNDSLTVYFAQSNGTVNGTIAVATRTSPSSAFGAPTTLTTTADASLAGLDPSVSPDGLTLYTQFNPSNFVEIMYATRTSTSAAFAPPTGVSNLSGSAPNHGAPFLRGDNSQLWYAARVAPDGGSTQGGNSIDIFVGTVSGQGQLSAIASETEINTTLDETAPALTPNGLTIFFARKVATDGGPSTTFHVFSSTRGAASDPFPAPALVPELDDMPTTNTQPTWISPDNCVIYIQSDRGGPAGAIYSAVRPL